MPERLFADYESREIARTILHDYRGKKIYPNDFPIIEITTPDGRKVTNRDFKQEKGFCWLLKKLTIFKFFGLYDVLFKVREADTTYYEDIRRIEAGIGPKIIKPKEVLAGASSYHSTVSEQEMYLDRKQKAEEKHKEAIKELNYYFVIGNFVSEASKLFATLNPKYSAISNAYLNGNSVEEAIEQCSITSDDYPELKKEFGAMLKDYRNNDPASKERIKNAIRHAATYEKKKSKKDKSAYIIMPYLTDDEIEKFLDFSRPNNAVTKNIQEIYGSFFEDVEAAPGRSKFDHKKYNIQLWKVIRETGRKDISALAVANLRAPVSPAFTFVRYL